jgi:4-amino-4-deoxy-L-arabinose transferase-like glycosyltransferase
MQLFGHGMMSLRVLSVFLSVAIIPFLALLGRQLLDPRVGVLAALLWAFSPLQIELATEARTYALVHLLVAANALFFVRWLELGRGADRLLYGLTMCVGCYSHYYFLLVPVMHLLVLTAVPIHRHRLISWFATMVIVGIGCLPWLPAFRAQLATPGNLTRAADRWHTQFLVTPVAFALGRSLAWKDAGLGMKALAAAATVLVFLLPAGYAIKRLWRPTLPGVLLIGWLAIPILLPAMFALLGKPLYEHRYATVGLPAFVLLVAAGWRLSSIRPRAALLVSAAVLSGISLYHYATKPIKDDWRSIMAATPLPAEPKTLFLFDTDTGARPFLHYARGRQAVPEGLVGIVDNSKQKTSLYGVRYARGRWLDQDPVDYSQIIFSSHKICLFLNMTPSRSSKDYETMFQKQGYRLLSQCQAYRIEALTFVKATE